MNALKIGCIRFTSNNVGKLAASSRNFHIATVLRDKSYYEILRVPHDATQSEIKEAYYKLSKVYHPDIKKDDQSLNMFRSITEAYDTLSNVQSRQLYDKGLGTNLPHDTLNEPFYSSMYGFGVFKGAAMAHESDKILDRKSILDEYLDQEYHDRKAEIRTYRNKLHVHQLEIHGEYGRERIYICGALTLLYMFWTFTEYHFSKRERSEVLKESATFRSFLKELYDWRFTMW